MPLPYDPSGNFGSSLTEEVKTVIKNDDVILSAEDDPCFLSPTVGNIHEISPITPIAAFLDILAPPYNGIDRDCHYYSEIKVPRDQIKSNIRWLQRTFQPDSYWCDTIKYKGPLLE